MKKIKKQLVISSLIMFLSTLLLIPLMTYLTGRSVGEVLRNGVFALFFSLGFLFFYHYLFYMGKFEYDNAEHPLRVFACYMAGLFLSICFPFIDKEGWVFLTIGIAISLFSNSMLGLYAVSGLIMFSVLLSNGTDIITFFVYFLSSFIGIILFQDIDKSFKVGSSIFVSVMSLTVLEVAGFVLLENKELSAEQFIIPIVNIAINSLALIFVLKYFNQVVANKYRNKYLEINDQEYKALIELKNVSKEEYFRSIHTAYLTERMANAIGCNVFAAKNCAYYHRIKQAFSLTDEGCLEFVETNQFPPEAKALLLDYLDESKPIVSKEEGIVYISDKFISSLAVIFQKDKNIKLDYASLVETMFDKNFIKDVLSDSDLSQKDIKLIKEIILKETLYYDFLR